MLRTFLTVFEEGGFILWPIFLVSMVAWYIGIVKHIQVRRILHSRRRFLRLLESPGEASSGLAAYDELLEEIRGGKLRGHAARRFAARQLLAKVVPDVERGFSTIATCATAAPLLGLLGTITGMNRMFGVIGEFGYGSPLLMAGAISIALQSSLTGLAVAVAAMFLHNYLRNRAAACVGLLMRDAGRLARERSAVLNG